MLKATNSYSIRCVVVLLLLATLLTFSVGGVIPVSALAEEITPELEPVYDTEVVSLKDYVDNVLTDAQVAVFNTILGSYVASQAGLNKYDLEYPYNDRTGVIGWLQDAGMKLYDAIITGGSFDIVTGTDLRTYIITAASYAVGMAQKAHSYTDMNDFLDDVDNSTHYFVPIDPVLQASINSYFGRDYGLWNWQFSSQPFQTTISWKTRDMGSYQIQYNSYYNTLQNPIKGNSGYDGLGWFNMYFDIAGKYNLFINTSTNRAYFVDDNGNSIQNMQVPFLSFWYNGGSSVKYVEDLTLYFHQVNITQFTYSTIVDLVNKLLNPTPYTYENYLLAYNNTRLSVSGMNDATVRYPFFGDILNHVYSGLNWATKQEVFNLTDLNFAQNDTPSYYQVPDNSYIDLKGFLTDIVNNTNILNVILDNLFKPDGTLNVDPSLIKVSITIPDTNPLPINLNEVALYLDNDYLDVVKQSATDYGNTIGQWFVFWHNSDPALLYTLLGSAIVILVGAFIGKWGHS